MCVCVGICSACGSEFTGAKHRLVRMDLIVVAVVQNTCTFHSPCIWRTAAEAHLDRTIIRHNFIPFSGCESTSMSVRYRSDDGRVACHTIDVVHGKRWHTFICGRCLQFYSAVCAIIRVRTEEEGEKNEKNLCLSRSCDYIFACRRCHCHQRKTHTTHIRTFIGYCSRRKENDAYGCCRLWHIVNRND